GVSGSHDALLPEEARQSACHTSADLVTAAPEEVLVLHRRIGAAPRPARQLAEREHALSGGFLEGREHAPLLVRHHQDEIGLGEEMTVALQVGGGGLRWSGYTDLLQHHLPVQAHRDHATSAPPPSPPLSR